MSTLDIILQERFLVATAIVCPIIAVTLQVTVDAKSRHISRAKVGASHNYCIALYSLSLVAAITCFARYKAVNIYAMGMALQSTFMLAVFFSAPLFHRKSGFKPAKTRVRLRGMAGQHDSVIKFLHTHFQRQGLAAYSGEKVGCTLLAVAGKINAKAAAGIQRRYRMFITLEPDGSDLLVHAEADVKEYVLKDSWETQGTKEAIRQLEQYLIYAYGQAVEVPDTGTNPNPSVPPPLPQMSL